MFQEETFASEIPQPFQKLASLLAMPPSENWDEFRHSFISHWGRKPGQERWQMKEVGLSPSRKEQVLQVLNELGMTSSWAPKETQYDYAILPGATVPSMKARLDWLAKQWQNGTRFKQIVVLTGQRPLTPEIDHISEVMAGLLPENSSLPTTFTGSNAPMHETEAARLLLYYYPYPQGMERVPVKFVDSPRCWQGGHWSRCHTATTVKDWLEYSPKPGAMLVISSQPSAHYQDSVFRREMPKGFAVETSTASLTQGYPMAVLLDAVATWLRTSDEPPELQGQ
ncbi:hypothetical protein [Sansalvadorimonas verongulae]|uniref:hypothetical protein n=1 Tax=Sansalvadorimonas verongulae TaxID=2172824 RepID=UPI0012BBD050|nr:hypothetical protein [Sansalvadorimonas verongulae]MTI12248.1 hypothetical protein [Sansalvadorimonas verongulae]